MGKRLKLEAAIPFWYNIPAEKRRRGRKPFRLVFDGFEGTITDHVIRLTDSVAVMSYRNDDEGEDGVSGVANMWLTPQGAITANTTAARK